MKNIKGSQCGISKNSHLFPEILGGLEVALDDEKPVVVEVGDDDVVAGREADAPGRIKVLPHVSLEAVLGDEVPVRLEQLDAVIPGVRDEDLVDAVAGHVPRVVELPDLGTALAKGVQEFAGYGEDLDAVVVLVGHDDAVFAVAAHARRPVELAAALARVAEVEAESAVLVVDLKLITKIYYKSGLIVITDYYN